MSDGPTTIEEYLAQGGTITRSRDADDGVHVVEVGDVRFEFERDDATTAPYRCRRTGVYGHRGSALNPHDEPRPYMCRKSCGAFATIMRGGVGWCEKHAPKGAS